MNSFILISKNKSLREKKALEICAEKNIEIVDITTLDKDTLQKNAKKKLVLSIGIENIKNLQEKIHLKPMKSIYKACIIHDAQSLTLEAQNSMLKILEEPPAHTLILLTADSKEALLPTVLSRCQLIEIIDKNELSGGERDEINKQAENLHSITISECLNLAEDLSKNKEQAINWMENMVIILREKLLNTISEREKEEEIWHAKVIKKFQESYQTIKTTNINLRMTLEALLLSIYSIS